MVTGEDMFIGSGSLGDCVEVVGEERFVANESKEDKEFRFALAGLPVFELLLRDVVVAVRTGEEGDMAAGG